MSLIPYRAQEGREIVLRHRHALVVRDRESRRLEIRGSECPTCHQPLGRSSSPERGFNRGYDASHEYVDPEYFRMLGSGTYDRSRDGGPPSPVMRLVEPRFSTSAKITRDAEPEASHQATGSAVFQSSTSDVPPPEGGKIRREAFSPNYFKTFFVEERVLGKGGKGVVLLVRHEIDGCALGHFACKRVPVGDDHSWLEKVLVEVELLAKLSHPNMVSYRHVWLEDIQLNRFGPTVVCAFILQQYCNSGDLHQYVVGSAPREATKEELKAQMRRRSKGQLETPQSPLGVNTRLPFEEIYSLFKDITTGVAYLHEANYVHRDLKPSNCLLHREGAKLTCLISDFGEVQPENVVRKSTGSTGTISYCAPEVLKADPTGRFGNFSTKSDIFSLGMILYFMCFGRLPYHGANAIQEELEDFDQLRAEITDWQGFQDERQERPDLPSKLYRLLKQLLAVDPAERPSANEVLLAMKREAKFDNIANADRPTNPPNTSWASRIHSLDSPLPPGTPVQDYEQANDSRTEPNKSRIHAPVSEYSTRDRGRETGNEMSYIGPTARSPEPRDNDSHEGQMPPFDQSEDIDMSHRLLIGPPRTRWGDVADKLAATYHRLGNIISLNQDMVHSAIHTGIFFIKLTSLLRPCWPYVPSVGVGLPLVVVAAIELRHPSLAAGHPFVNQRRSPHREASAAASRPWSFGATLLLLGFHFAMLWISSRWGVLCFRSSVSDWAEWN